jgi:hypothetical protein
MFEKFRKIKKYGLQIINLVFIKNLFKAVFKLTIDNFSVLFSYIDSGNLNIRICRDITGEIWFGVG